jgi:hypothetical protein
VLTEPQIALAGVMLETSFAMFKHSMAVFNAETVPSRPFCCCDPEAILWLMVETRKS